MKAVAKAATEFPLAKVLYFGSYADGRATNESDLDILVKFTDGTAVSLLDVIHFKHNLEDELHISVDVVGLPLTKRAQKLLKIKKRCLSMNECDRSRLEYIHMDWIWEIVARDIPELLEQVKKILQKW
ncbi:MAG: nucleotidyltransferase domain-containing protein [Methanomicrobiales archaeon]|nr:nucleotidyltransferase domain-containing protein [Methanomicrobiales archaeon]